MDILMDTIVTSIVVGLIFFFLILTDPEKAPADIIFFKRLLPIGLFLLLSASIGNSAVEGNWDTEYILEFLRLKIVGEWLFRILAASGYIFIVTGGASILAITIKKCLNKKKKL